jgi:hypothetical protein
MSGVIENWACTYPQDETEIFNTFNELDYHITTRDASPTAAEYEQLKGDDGWLDGDWMGTKLSSSSKRALDNR